MLQFGDPQTNKCIEFEGCDVLQASLGLLPLSQVLTYLEFVFEVDVSGITAENLDQYVELVEEGASFMRFRLKKNNG